MRPSRRSFRTRPGALVAALIALAPIAAGVFAPGCAAQETRPAAADELLVGFVSGTTDAEAVAIYTPLGASTIEAIPAIAVHRIRVGPGSIESVERALKANPAVRFVERNQRVRTN